MAFLCDLGAGREDAPACRGGRSVSSRQERASWSACSARYEGHFCQSCAEGNHTVNEECQPCDDNASSSGSLLVVMLMLMLRVQPAHGRARGWRVL